MTDQSSLRGKKGKILGKVFLAFAICHVWQQRGERKEVQKGSSAEEATECWTVSPSHQGCLLTWATERRYVGVTPALCAIENTVVPCWTRTCKKRGDSDHSRGATGQRMGEKNVWIHTGVKRYPPKTLACKKTQQNTISHKKQIFFKAPGYHMTQATATY